MRQLAALPDDQPSSSVDISDSCDNASAAAAEQTGRMPPPIFCTESDGINDDHPFTPTSPPSTSGLNASCTRSSLAPDNAFRDQPPSPSGSGGSGVCGNSKLRTVSQSSCLSTSSATSQTRSPKRVSFLVNETSDRAERKPLKESGHKLGTYSDEAAASTDKSDKDDQCCCAVM